MEERRREAVKAIRRGMPLRVAGRRFGMAASTVDFWVRRAKGNRLDRVSFADRHPGRATNRTSETMEHLILATRQELRQGVLGEFGPDAITLALQSKLGTSSIPSRATIHRVLTRYGALDAVGRQRRAAPPKGWYLPQLADAKVELDSFDFIEGVNLKGLNSLTVLTATSLHGALADAWIFERSGSRVTVQALLERWQREGLPTYAQFDNDSIFQGANQFWDNFGLVSRLCLALEVTQVFAPPYEHGFQNSIEGFNGLWQDKVWRRRWFDDLSELRLSSARYIEAHRAKTTARRDLAPKRRPFPKSFRFNPHASLAGKIIFIRRTDANTGHIYLPGGNPFQPDKRWCGRLVRCEIDFTRERLRFYALRRRDPAWQPLLNELPYPRPTKPFKGTL